VSCPFKGRTYRLPSGYNVIGGIRSEGRVSQSVIICKLRLCKKKKKNRSNIIIVYKMSIQEMYKLTVFIPLVLI
jgi:hypothetical protein